VSGDTAALGELPVADVAVERLLSTENVNCELSL
jgi:hypothetical protein